MKFCSVIIKYHNNEYLFLERPNHNFVPPCGGIEKSEDPRDCATRELFEETGINISKNDLLLLDYWSNNFIFSFIFIARVLNKKVTISNEHINYIWEKNLELMQHKTDFDLSKWPLFRNLNEFYMRDKL